MHNKTEKFKKYHLKSNQGTVNNFIIIIYPVFKAAKCQLLTAMAPRAGVFVKLAKLNRISFPN